MAYIFSISPGTAAALVQPTVVPINFRLGSGDLAFRNLGTAALQTVQLQTTVNYQLLPTLRNYYYLYVFGELPANVKIEGMAMSRDCAEEAGTDGITLALNYYDAVTLSVRGAPIYLQIGARSFQAFVTGGFFAIVNPTGNLGQFSFDIKTAPGG